MNQTNNQVTNSDRISALTAEITTYTAQIEEYDRSSNNLIMTCVAFAGVLLSVTGAVSGLVDSSAGSSTTLFYEISAIAVALVPCVATLFLYLLCMNCRRVAQFRGYVKFLEQCVNDKVGANEHLYNTLIDPKMMEGFKVNQVGPGFMIFFWGVLFFVSAVLGFQLVAHSDGVLFRPAYNVFFTVVLFVSFVCSAICIYWLTKNGEAMEETYRICIEADKGRSNIDSNESDEKREGN